LNGQIEDVARCQKPAIGDEVEPNAQQDEGAHHAQQAHIKLKLLEGVFASGCGLIGCVGHGWPPAARNSKKNAPRFLGAHLKGFSTSVVRQPINCTVPDRQ
jgi:hypothetical protein